MPAKPELNSEADRNECTWAATHGLAVTPSDTVDIDAPFVRGLHTGSGGTIQVLMRHDTAPITLVNVPAGVVLGINVKRVYATLTTATGMNVLW